MENIWFSLIQFARWTPSPHNVQAWKVKIISNDSAELYYDAKRLLPITDPTGCFSVMGMAMFVDSLDIASSKFNMQIEVNYLKEPFNFIASTPILFANLKLVPRTRPNNVDPELIKERRTSRLPYNNVPVPIEQTNILENVCKEYNQNFLSSSDSEMVKWIMDLNRDTLFYDMGDEHARKEIGNLLRFNEREAREKRWSLVVLFPYSRLVYEIIFNYEKFFEFLVIKYILLSYYETTMRGTRTVAWIKGPFKTFDDFILAGYGFNRLWLKMQEMGIYLHPFGSVITNPHAHERLRERFKIDEDNETVWMLLRIGFSSEPPRSLRLDTDDILIK